MVVTPVNFKQEPFRAMPDDEWFWHVKEGVPGSLMPVWKTTLDDTADLDTISYVQQMYAQPFYHDPDEGRPRHRLRHDGEPAARTPTCGCRQLEGHLDA